jgi:long-chain acyl-CoA synthetase
VAQALLRGAAQSRLNGRSKASRPQNAPQGDRILPDTAQAPSDTTLPPGFPARSIAEINAILSAPGAPFELEEITIHGVRTKVYKNAAPTVRELFEAAKVHNARTLFVLEDERVTYDAHRRAAIAIACQLIADGVKKGDRVAIIMRNLPEWSAAFFGAMLAGAIVTPLNAWWTGPELEYGLSDSGTRIALCDAERWERIREHVDNCPELARIYVCRAFEEIADPRVKKLEEVIGPTANWPNLPERPVPDVPIAPDDDLTIFYTSGTTGKPKGAIGSHRNIISNMMNAMFAMARSFLRRGEVPPAPDPALPQRAMLLSVPFFHATGCFAVLIPALSGGVKIVLQRRWDVDKALELIQREKINQFGGVPTIAWQVIEHPRVGEYDLSSVESVSYGGAPSAPELVKRIRQMFPKALPGQGWGMTETSATATSNGSQDYELRPWSCGVAPPAAEAKIVDQNGKELPRGEVGELWYKGPSVVRGYWNKPQATAETFVDGWVKTGDLAKMDEEGFIGIVDRAKDMLIRGGENIYCVEVENALYEHPAVMDAAVIGIPHKTLGEEPGAVVHLKAGMKADEAELRHFVSQQLAAFKVPVKIAFWPETLPRNPQGKILKRELKGVFSADS